MTVITNTKERRVVPRWRLFHTAIAVRELGTPKETLPDELLQELDGRRREWQLDPSIMTASDLVHTAALAGKLDSVADAVQCILNTPSVPDLVKQSTRLSEDGYVDKRLVDVSIKAKVKIAYLKRALHKWPRNAIVWTQLALLYCQLGVEEKAKRCIRIATSLASSNRYVLRSAARFFVHIDDAEQGRDLLRNTARTKYDPWLLAAEISASQVMRRTSTLLKVGSNLLERREFTPSDTTELAASLGTEELDKGSIRKAKKLFGQGARAPNDNVRAHLQWVESNHSDASPSTNLEFSEESDNEARAFGYERMEDWNSAVESAWAWGGDEPFSERPFVFGSHLAIEMLGNADLAQKFASKGIEANRQDSSLLNNYAVALAIQGDLEKASGCLKMAKRHSRRSPSDKLVFSATEGLLEYRSGNIQKARELYLDAMKMASVADEGDLGKRAAIYMAIEELEAETEGGRMLARVVLNKIKEPFVSKVRPLIKRLRNKAEGVSIGSSSKIHRSVDELIQKLR